MGARATDLLVAWTLGGSQAEKGGPPGGACVLLKEERGTQGGSGPMCRVLPVTCKTVTPRIRVV
jgi:hypothetical protein